MRFLEKIVTMHNSNMNRELLAKLEAKEKALLQSKIV
jgi:hypothetical protein